MAEKWNPGGYDRIGEQHSAQIQHNMGNYSITPHELSSVGIQVDPSYNVPNGNATYSTENVLQPTCYSAGITADAGNQTSTKSTEMSNLNNQLSIEKNQLMCFVCSNQITDRNQTLIKTSMNHSHAPLVVLLTDILGYKLEDSKLHSQCVCKSCYRLLDIIDELQQTLTESKTDVRTKFLETLHHRKLKYPRTDKMLRPRCVRCTQIQQVSAKKKGKPGKFSKSKIVGRAKGKIQSIDGDTDQIQNQSDSNINQEVDDVTINGRTKEDSNIASDCPSSSTVAVPSTATSVVFDTDPAFFSSEERLKVGVHQEIDGFSCFVCLYCSANHFSTSSLKMHVRAFHLPSFVYDNANVHQTETRRRVGIKLQNGTPSESGSCEKPFACLFCECAYKLQSSLQLHYKENHSPHKPFKCQDCKEAFRRTIELSRHRLYRCPVKNCVAGGKR